MTKQNVLEKMTAVYEAANAHTDAGKRYLALESLNGKIHKLINNDQSSNGDDMAKMTNVGRVFAVATAIGVSIFTPESIPLAGDVAIAGLSALGGFLGGGAFGGIAYLALEEKLNGSRAVNYVKNIAAHKPALQELSAQIANDMADILKDENLPVLTESSVLGTIMKKRPNLTQRFDDAARVAFENKKQAANTQKNSKGFDL